MVTVTDFRKIRKFLKINISFGFKLPTKTPILNRPRKRQSQAGEKDSRQIIVK